MDINNLGSGVSPRPCPDFRKAGRDSVLHLQLYVNVEIAVIGLQFLSLGNLLFEFTAWYKFVTRLNMSRNALIRPTTQFVLRASLHCRKQSGLIPQTLSARLRPYATVVDVCFHCPHVGEL